MTVGMILFPEFTQLDLTGPYEVFSRLPDCKVELLSVDGEPVRSENGLTISATNSFDDAPRINILFVPGGPGVNRVLEDDDYLSFVRTAGEKAQYVTSVCTGALLLAAAGLLTGYRATTHWLSLELLPYFGAIPMAQRVVIDRNRITGAGVTAGIDFALSLAGRIAGTHVAREIQLMLEYAPDPPFHSGTPEDADPELVELVRKQRSAIQAERLAQAQRISNKIHV
jgi:cyclohexyl-isocyanide hydratase